MKDRIPMKESCKATDKILKWILMKVVNILLERIVNSDKFKTKKKGLVYLINTILDSIEDGRIDEEEIAKVKSAIGNL